MAARIPEKFRDLITTKKAFADLATVSSDGQPQGGAARDLQDRARARGDDGLTRRFARVGDLTPTPCRRNRAAETAYPAGR